MGSANSTISPEPFIAAVAVAGVLGYSYVHYVHPSHAGGTDADANTNATFLGLSKGPVPALHGQKKRGRKMRLPGDATLKNLDFLDSSGSPLPPAAPPVPATVTRQRQRNDVVPGGFEGADASEGPPRSSPSHQPLPEPSQQQLPEQSAGVKKSRKKKGKKTASDHSSVPADAEPTPAPAVRAEKAQASAPDAGAAVADAQDERWTRVEARKKKATPAQEGLSELQTTATADSTTSDAGITTSVTGNSSPVTERTTEDELPSGLDECVELLDLIPLATASI